MRCRFFVFFVPYLLWFVSMTVMGSHKTIKVGRIYYSVNGLEKCAVSEVCNWCKGSEYGCSCGLRRSYRRQSHTPKVYYEVLGVQVSIIHYETIPSWYINYWRGPFETDVFSGEEKLTFGNGGGAYNQKFNTTAGASFGWPLSFTTPDIAKCIYRIYCELALNLRIKPKKRLYWEIQEPLSVPTTINDMCPWTSSMISYLISAVS